MRLIFTLLLFVISLQYSSAQLIINEVLYDPSNNALDGDANGDGVYGQDDDSFIELYNPGPGNFDASGYEIWDDTIGIGTLQFTAPAGTFIPPNGVWVIFGGGNPTGSFGGAIVSNAMTGLNFNNSGEVIIIRDSQGNEVLTFDSDALSNNPNESYTRNPDITGAFEQHADNTSILFSPGIKVDGSPFDTLFVAESISVNAMGGADSINTPGGTLQMEAVVLPVFADDQTVSWSVPVGNGVATIDAAGLLTAVGNGSVMVTGTTNDGTNLSDSLNITVTNQVLGISEALENRIKLFPNPASNNIVLESEIKFNKIMISNLQGQVLIEGIQSKSIDISKLRSGTYVIRALGDDETYNSIFIKE